MSKPKTFIRGITLRRPWPWAICFAGKRVENRTWAPRSIEDEHGEKHWLLREFADGFAPARQSVRLSLAIHAGAALDEDAYDHLHRRFIERGGIMAFDNAPSQIVGVARYAGVIDVWKTLRGDPGRRPHEEWIWVPDEGQLDGDRRPYAWVLDDVVVFRQPIPAKGHQGLWRLEPGLLAAVRRKYAEVIAYDRANASRPLTARDSAATTSA